MSGRKSLRSRGRTDQLDANNQVVQLGKQQNGDIQQRKRQRRLTAHQGGAGSKQLHAAAASRPQDARVAKSLADAKSKMRAITAAVSDPVCRPIDKNNDISNANAKGYLSSGPSVKMAPGKRIKWRSAISEEDIVRQNLHQLFVSMSFE